MRNYDEQYLNEIKNIDFYPVFILGLHRSGTSILYKMLTATNSFNSVTAYHLIKYNQLLFDYKKDRIDLEKNKLTESIQVKDRGIDRLKIDADFAEEYGFLLGQKTFEMYITNKNKNVFKEMCKKIQYISNNKKPILLKNPYDLSNFIFIKSIFPNSKFIFIQRHPFKTLSSSIKAIQVLFKAEKNPYTTYLFKIYNKIFENPILLSFTKFIFCRFPIFGMIFLTRFSSSATKYYLKNVKKLKNEDFIVTTYENLCKNPQENIMKIMDVLKIKINKNQDFNNYIKPRKTDLDKSVKILRNYIFYKMKKYFKEFNYKIEED